MVSSAGSGVSLVLIVMKSISYFLVWQKRKLSDKPVEAGEDYTKFNSADFARKVSVCGVVWLSGLNIIGGLSGFEHRRSLLCFISKVIFSFVCWLLSLSFEYRRVPVGLTLWKHVIPRIELHFVIVNEFPAVSGQGCRVLLVYFLSLFPLFQPPKKMTSAQKTLAKVDKTGMKPMSSFFSPKVKAEKKWLLCIFLFFFHLYATYLE